MIHPYGLAIGIAIVVGLWLMEIQANKHLLNSTDFYSLSWVILLGGVVGARLYHVMTEFSFYQHQLLDIFKVWQGGMSIIGGVIGGVLSLWLFLKFHSLGKKMKLMTILDLSVFGLPVAQAIGRWGNYFNQELYGTPTQLPWKIYIEPAARLVGYEQFSYFHPLFFYEMMLMLLFAGGVWWGQKQTWFSGFSIGSGKLFLLYIFYYSFIRFWLDFIRIDKTHFLNTSWGLNQLLLLIVMLISVYWWRKK